MREGLSRRGWLLGLFAGMTAWFGWRQKRVASPPSSPPAGNAPGEFAYRPGFLTCSPWPDGASAVVTLSYDPAAGLLALPATQVTTFTYFYDPPERSA